MTTYSKFLLSESTGGKNILISATGSVGTLIHTSVAGSTSLDEIWVYAANTSTAPLKLTIEWGSTGTPTDLIEASIPGEEGLFLLVPGLLLNNSNTVRGFAGVENLVVVNGFVNRIVP